MLTMYSKKTGCGGCIAGKRWLQSPSLRLIEGEHYQILDVEDLPESELAAIEALGATGTPFFVIDDEESFQGFRVDRLMAWHAGLFS